jgi:phosphate/sulfate permease
MGFEIDFMTVTVVISMLFLVWSCVEVGSNDAANLVNAVFGARIMKRKNAVLIAGLFVVLGATFSSPVMDTVRKGIFDLSIMNAEMALSIFVSAYLVGTLLLYIYSVFGMPVSTTATLVFCLAGGAIGAYGGGAAVNWPKLSQVILAIVASIAISGVFAFIGQRSLRKVLGRNATRASIGRNGPWITGVMLTSMIWFMIVKGMKDVTIVKSFKQSISQDNYLTVISFLTIWAMITLVTHIYLKSSRDGHTKLFRGIALIGMACMAFAFGQNDLANAASPGIASLLIWQNGLVEGSKISIPMLGLVACGILIFFGMRTKRATRVTRAEVNTASQYNKVNLYAPNWCIRLGSSIVKREDPAVKSLAPKSQLSVAGKKVHYDAIRASVILSVGACVIAFASGLGLPVSTTYVAFAAVVATGWGDRIFRRGDSSLKIGRSIWVVTGWFMSAGIAMVCCGVSAAIVYHFRIPGLLTLIVICLIIRSIFKKRSDIHEQRYHRGIELPGAEKGKVLAGPEIAPKLSLENS